MKIKRQNYKMDMLENKVSELEKRLKELEEENRSTRKKLDELIYHFMHEIGVGMDSDHDHSMIQRNVKKAMLKALFPTNAKEITEEIIFGKDYYEKLELRQLSFGEQRTKLEGIIDEMTEEECEKRLNEIFKAEFKENMESAGDDPEHVKKKLEKIIEYESYLKFGLLEIITRSSEGLWTIFDKIREKKEFELEQFRKEIIRPYLEKYDETCLMIEKQKETEKLAIIKEKETELKRLKKDLNAE